MELTKLFDMQRKLDDHIMDEHPELKGQNNLDWKILALLVELGECANEWRGFKKWSKDQEPRTEVKCIICNGDGYVQDSPFSVGPCFECLGTGKVEGNPLLEEYVDCLHFTLSIGLEMNVKKIKVLSLKKESITVQFINLFNAATIFKINYSETAYLMFLSAFIGLGELLGFTWEQIEEAYFSKNAVNHARQESGY
jgi:dimeric dUTPase (all-alpha-NTP-PPase superfamily)